ncbi:MAG: hypothetical protein K0S02_4947 [Achromobacter mucicolens]|uniref:TniB family NTP-binding protein n=1 Tax=Achromobacter mucicolens TaxID=1389922 RepID=UPI00242E51A2|nr:TniB family NTP-binding protein [Achromobacter mucicolens]MDF2864675.1 hypothetical protein [Achromobacter mucicolens]
MNTPLDILCRTLPSDLAQRQSLFGFRLPIAPIQHRRFSEGLCRIAELHHSRQRFGSGGGVLITGPSGAGKTLLVSCYASQFAHETTLAGTRIPVLRLTVPSSPTAKSLSETILIALGYPKAHRGSGPQKTALILEFFDRCGLELMILDEVHHLLYASTIQYFRDVTDWLKNLISIANVAVVACGLPEAIAVVEANEQLASRFSARYALTPLGMASDTDFREFRSVLKLFGEALPLPMATPLHEANMARRMHVASYGLLDYVRKVLEGAVSVAASVGDNEIGLDALAAAFRNCVCGTVPDRLNPFHPDSYLRPLDRPGEVFYLHTSQDLVASVVAKRVSLNAAKARP